MEPLSKILGDKTSPSESRRMKGTHKGTQANPKQPALLFITGFQYKTKSTDHVNLSCLENKLGTNKVVVLAPGAPLPKSPPSLPPPAGRGQQDSCLLPR